MISQSPTWEALKAEQTPGRCCICEAPTPPSRKTRRLCGGRDCARTFNTIHQSERRSRLAAAESALRTLLLLADDPHSTSGAWADAVATGWAALRGAR